MSAFSKGQLVRVVAVSHPCASREVGTIQVVKEVWDSIVWCSPHALYERRRRNGTIELEPPCWSTAWMPHQLEAELDPAFLDPVVVPAPIPLTRKRRPRQNSQGDPR